MRASAFPYVAALALQEGRVPLSAFSHERFSEQETLLLADRIRVRSNDIGDPSRFTPQELTAVCQDGRQLQIKVEHLLGSPQHPMTLEAREEKITECLLSVGGDRARAKGLLSLTEDFWRCHDSRVLLDCVTPD